MASNESSSSVKYRTLKYEGSAKEQEDYIPVNDILGFAPGETEKTITIRTVQSVEREADEDFYIILRKNTPMLGSDVQTTFDCFNRLPSTKLGTFTDKQISPLLISWTKKQCWDYIRDDIKEHIII